MIKMKLFRSLEFFCAILTSSLVIGVLTHHTMDNGEYGHFHKWRKALCERKNQTFFDDAEACFQKESKMIRDATVDCVNDALPDAKGKLNTFDEAACKNISLYHKFDKCFDEYDANPSFKKQVHLTPDAKDCYMKIIVKYNLTDMPYFD